jgi:uncharacterized protein (DUF58 family)
MTAVSDKRTRSTLIPVTTMEEVPVLTEQERAEMLAALKEAETRIDAGAYVVYDPATYKDRLMAIYREARAARKA